MGASHATEIRVLRGGDESVLENVAADVFDDPLDARSTRTFLYDPRHHLAVAVDDDLVVGFASAVEYVHPDKPQPELWRNEIGVAPTHQKQGLGRVLLQTLLEVGRAVGCMEAWVLTDRGNAPAMRLYSALGGNEAPGDAVMFEFALTATDSTPPARVEEDNA